MAVVELDRPGRPARAGVARRRPRLVPYLFVAPAILFALVFLYYPSVSALYHSLYDWDGTNLTFLGLDNFREMWSDPNISRAFQNVLKLTSFGMVVELIVPLGVARLIIALRQRKAQDIFRILFIIPLVVPLVVFYLMWQFIYDPTSGLLNNALGALKLGGLQQGWLGDPNLALYCLMFVGFPFVDGFGLLIYTAGLQAISQETLEAAQMDGAGALSRFFRIEIPLILGQIRLMMVLTLIQGVGITATGLQQFTAVLILTDGGPTNLTTVPGLELYHQAFVNNYRYGYACAIGTVMFLLIMVLTVINLRFLRPSTEFEAAG